MVYTTKRYHCRKCHKAFADYDEAQSCEIEHIVGVSVDRVKAAIAAAFIGSPKKCRIKREG